MRHLPGSRAPQALSVDGFQMKRPYRTPGTGIHNAARYHDTKGRPIFSSGRLRYGRVPYDTFPDTPPVRCAGTTNFGAPCKNWAVLTKTLCRWHGGGSRRPMRPPCRVKACPIAGRFPRAQCGGRKERHWAQSDSGAGRPGTAAWQSSNPTPRNSGLTTLQDSRDAPMLCQATE